MTIMKRLSIIFLAAAATFAACTKFVEDPKIEYAEIGAPEVSAAAVDDYTVTVTITPQEGTTFYSYIVAKGKALPLDAEKLLKCKYESSAITFNDKPVSAICNMADQASVSLTIEDLMPDTRYTVYAVATNAQGVISEVATATALTTDGTAPVFDDKFAFEEQDSLMLFQIAFDDKVMLTGEGSFSATFYAINGTKTQLPNGLKLLNPLGDPMTIASDYIFDDSGYIYVMLPKTCYIPGAYVGISWTDGVAKNSLGATVTKNEAAIGIYSGQILKSGVIGRYETVPFDLALTEADDTEIGSEEDEEDEEPEYFYDWEELTMVAYARTEHPLFGFTKSDAVRISATQQDQRVVSYNATQFGVNGNKVLVALDEDPDFRSYISYSIEAGAIQDLYGNTNNAYSNEDGFYYSYGYTLDDVIGNYEALGYEYDFSTKELAAFGPETLTIKASNNPAQGNVMITNYFGIPCKAPVYADFNVNAGTLTIFEWQAFYDTLYQGGDTPDDKSDDVVANYYHSSNNEEDLVLNMYESGVLSNPSDSFGAYLYISKEMQGYNFMLVDVTATKVSESEGPTATPATISFEFPSNARRTMKPVIKL